MAETTVQAPVRRRMIRLVLASLATLTVIVPVTASRADAGFRRGEQISGTLTPLRAGPSTGRSTQVGSSARPRDARAATIAVTYSGFTTAARNAFQAAVDIWETKLNSPVTIRIQANFTNLGNTGILGSAGPNTFHRNFSGAKPDTWYPQAIANKIAGADLDPASADISANFNNQFPNWYFGTGGPGPANTYDFETVVMHEIGHGLGFLLSFRQSGSQILHSLSAGNNSSPFIEDTFATDNQGRLANRFPSGSNDFKNAVTGGNLFWNGNKGKQANGGNRPKLYAPSPFAPGSSASHLNEATFPQGTAHSLMTPFLNQGERIVNPGGISIGILEDSGWAAPK
jgi:hypothetical protein